MLVYFFSKKKFRTLLIKFTKKCGSLVNWRISFTQSLKHNHRAKISTTVFIELLHGLHFRGEAHRIFCVPYHTESSLWETEYFLTNRYSTVRYVKSFVREKVYARIVLTKTFFFNLFKLLFIFDHHTSQKRETGKRRVRASTVCFLNWFWFNLK